MMNNFSQLLPFPIAWLLLLTFFLSSCKEKERKNYDEHGRITSVLRYDDEGRLHGLCEWYYPNGNKQMESVYQHNTLEGEQKRYHENGLLQSVSYYRKNMLDSTTHQYSINGKLIAIENYRNDTLHGSYQRLFETGQTMVEGIYKYGKMHDQWLFYDASGRIVGTASFQMGTGIQKGFHPNGKLARIIHYIDNQKHGPEEFYDFEGKHYKTAHYNFGSLVKEENILP